MSILEVKDVKKSYKGFPALKGVSFTVQEGEIFSIMGPNGAGKTTLIESILGTKKMDSGSVSILGMDPVTSRNDVFENVGVQFQDMNWRPGIKVKEMCELTSVLYKKEIDWEIKLKEFDLSHLKDKTVELCSGGERQKLSILLSTLHEPKLLILDELTTGLDPLARRETWDLLKEMNSTGTTIVLTSHFMDEVEFLSNRGFLLNSGEVLYRGSIEELKELGKGHNLDESYLNLIQGVTL